MRIEIRLEAAKPLEEAQPKPGVLLRVQAGANEAEWAACLDGNGTRGADSVPVGPRAVEPSRAENERLRPSTESDRGSAAHAARAGTAGATEAGDAEHVLAARERELTTRMELLERELAERRAELDSVQTLAESEKARLERRERHLAEMERALQERARELDAKEAAVELREAQLEVAFGLREERIEQRERDLAALETRLERKESELAAYVARVQRQLAHADGGSR